MIEVADRDRQARVAKHPLHHVRREVLAEVGGVRMAEAVRVDTLLDPGLERQALAELAHVGVAELLPAAGAADHAEIQLAACDAELFTFSGPDLEQRAGGGVDRDDAPLIALAVQDRDPAVRQVDVLGVEREPLAYPHTGWPYDCDERVAPAAGAWASTARRH